MSQPNIRALFRDALAGSLTVLACGGGDFFVAKTSPAEQQQGVGLDASVDITFNRIPKSVDVSYVPDAGISGVGIRRAPDSGLLVVDDTYIAFRKTSSPIPLIR